MKKQFLSFRLDKEWYLVDVFSVLEIISYIEPAPVPGSPPAILGIINIRGEILPVISAYNLFSLPSPTDFNAQKVIIIESTTANFGIVVDELEDIVTLEPDQIDYTVEGRNNDMISGTVNHKDRISIVVSFSDIQLL